MELRDYRQRLEDLQLQAMHDRVPVELSSALSAAVNASRILEEQAACRHFHSKERYGQDCHGAVWITYCTHCGKTLRIVSAATGI